MKGLLVDVIGSDCTNGGVTSGKKMAVLLSDKKSSQIFEPSDKAPGLIAVEESAAGSRAGYLVVKNDWDVIRIRIVPYVDGEAVLGGIFGGNFIITCDSRYPYATPAPVFDRFE